MENYNPKKIEPKWQKKWEELGLYKAKDFDKPLARKAGFGPRVAHKVEFTGFVVQARVPE